MSTPFQQILEQLLSDHPSTHDVTPQPPEDLVVSPDPMNPRPEEVRREGMRRWLTNFTYSLGTGLESATQNPRGVGQRTQAGIAQSLKLPAVLQAQLEAKRLQAQKDNEERLKTLAQLGIQQGNLDETRRLRQVQEETARTNAANIAADNARAQAEANKPKIQNYPPGSLIIKTDKDGNEISRETVPTKESPTDDKLEPDKVMVDGVGTAVLRDAKGNYFDANTKQPVTGRITPYIAPPAPRQRGEITPTAEADLITKLNKQWEAAAKDVQSLYRANTIMKAGMDAARRGDMNAGSQAVLVTFQKFIDPTSVVRESEYARSGAGQSMANRVRGWIEKLEQGGAGMTLPELETFAKAAQEISDNLNKEGSSLLSAERDRIKTVADRYGIPVETVIPKYQYNVPGGTTQPPSTSQSQVREQYSQSTKQYRHSLDGGKTWTAGRAPK